MSASESIGYGMELVTWTGLAAKPLSLVGNMEILPKPSIYHNTNHICANMDNITAICGLSQSENSHVLEYR